MSFLFFLSPVFLLNLSVCCFNFVELCLASDCLELLLSLIISIKIWYLVCNWTQSFWKSVWPVRAKLLWVDLTFCTSLSLNPETNSWVFKTCQLCWFGWLHEHFPKSSLKHISCGTWVVCLEVENICLFLIFMEHVLHCWKVMYYCRYIYVWSGVVSWKTTWNNRKRWDGLWKSFFLKQRAVPSPFKWQTN